MSTINGWHTKRFDEFGELFSGSTPSTANSIYWGGDVVWITPADLSKLKSRYIHNSAKQITEKGLAACSTHLLPVGSIVLSSRAPIGYVALPTVPFCTNQGCKTVKLRDGYDSEFAYFNILFNIKKVKDLGEGTTFAEISKTALAGVELDFPTTLDEQKKIAEVLSTVDRAIEDADALIAKQRRVKAGLMQDLLRCGIDEQGRLRSEARHKFKNSPVGRIPVEWDPSTLEHVGDWLSGGTPSKSNPAYWGDEVPWICPKDMKTFDLTTTTHRLTRAGAHHGSREVPANSVFIVVRGMILAHTFPVSISNIPMAFNQDVKAIVACPDIEPRFLAYWFVSNGSKLLKITTTATHGTKRFDMKELFEVAIALPKRPEQARIVKRLDAAEMEVAVNRKIAAKLRSLKSGLMQDLLTGRKRVAPLLEASRRMAAQGS
jgi:type I restriction enzyme S subunit